MRIIDEKGRLFSRVNVIDFLVILLLLFLIPGVYFGYKILSVSRKQVQEFVNINLNCLFVKLKPEILNKISVGDSERGRDGETIGKIVSLGEPEAYRYELEIGRNIRIVTEDPVLKQMDAVVEMRAELRQGKPFYKNSEIKIGAPLIFKTGEYTIESVPYEKGEERVIDLNVILKNLDDKTMKKIEAGDKEIDQNGKTVAEILSLGKVERSYAEIDLGSGNIVRGEESNRTQIYAKMRLNCLMRPNNEFYFKGTKVGYYTPFSFKTPKYEVRGVTAEEYVQEGEERVIDLNVIFNNLDDDTLKKIAAQDKEIGEDGKVIAQVVSLGKIVDNSLNFEAGERPFVGEEKINRKQLFARMRFRCLVKNDNQLYYQREKVEENTPIEFKTSKYHITGFPAEKFQPFQNEKWFTVTVKFSRVVPELAQVITKGDTEKDEFGNTIARINSVISNEPALVTDIYMGEFIILPHPFERDIVASIDVLCLEKEGAYYYKEELAKIGVNKMTLNTDLYSITGLIISLKEK